ncbi:hypothetical protein [Rhizobium sp. Leaf383]|uniref:hypothetical protein n=1 Tax=Rhizobium sp. Leaf383 TaxID=1736357 RepID=UPI000AA161C2|nr:hypothetical protein [Rhizobium sp. Leaf383]
MTLEKFTAQINGFTFWREFTFSQNRFSPRPGQQLELADSFVWLGETAFIIQMKERTEPKDDPDAERRWFRGAVLRTAVCQIRDSLRFLDEHESIAITNERGQRHEVSKADLAHVEKIIRCSAGASLPEDCRMTRHHISQTAGFIHVFERDDYAGVIRTLGVPDEVRRYLEYRQRSIPRLSGSAVKEEDILGAYLNDEELPGPTSHKVLERLVDDAEDSDLTPIMNRLADHIQNPGEGGDYARILLEFARLPRSAWRMVRERLDLSIRQAMQREFAKPYRFYYLAPTAASCSSRCTPTRRRVRRGSWLEGRDCRTTPRPRNTSPRLPVVSA